MACQIDLVDPSINIGRLIGAISAKKSIGRPTSQIRRVSPIQIWILGRMHHAKNRHNPHDQCHTGNIPLREMTVLAPTDGK